MSNAIRDWRTRFMRGLRDRFSLRWHMTLIIVTAAVLAALLSKLLLHVGLTSMPLRYGVVTLAAYLVFFLLIKLWIRFVATQVPEGGAAEAVVAEAGGAVAVGALDAERRASTSSGGGDAGGSGGDFSFDLGSMEGEGAAIVIVVGVAVAVIFGAGIFVVWHAPAILAEAAVGGVLAGALGRATGRANAAGWVVGVLRATIVPALIIFAVAVATGVVVHWLCPTATKLSQAFSQCVF